MDEPGNPPSGWRESARRMADSFLGLVHSRVELFSVELQEEKLRSLATLTWFGLAFGLGLAGLLVALAALSLFLWEVARYAGLAGLAVVLLGASAGLVFRIRQRIHTGPPPFHETINEFKKDRECLRPRP